MCTSLKRKATNNINGEGGGGGEKEGTELRK